MQRGLKELPPLQVRLEALEQKTAAAYVFETAPEIPSGVETVPLGWSIVGEAMPAVALRPEGFRFNTSGVFLVTFTGSYNTVSTTSTMEYRILLNSTRLLALFGAGDYSSRSEAIAVVASAGDVLQAQYFHSAGQTLTLRGNAFNTISFAQIA